MNRRKDSPDPVAAIPDVPLRHVLRVGTLSRATPFTVDLQPDRETLDALTGFLGLASVRTMRFKGHVRGAEKDGWRVVGRLTASVTQTCVVTLDPVPEEIDERIDRLFLPEGETLDTDASDEIDVDAEGADDPDSFGDEIDVGALAVEVLTLCLNPFPRIADEEPVEMLAGPPGVAALDDDAIKPFAGLAALKARLEGGET